jgi:hypothetical protein
MILLQSILSNMDKEPIMLMLQSIKSTASVGPKPHQYIPGDRVLFALEHGLLVRSSTGNLVMTEKGDNLLVGKLNWESL